MYKFLIRPLLFRLPVDSAHEAAINLAETSSRNKVLLKAAGALFNYSDPSLTQKIWGLTFPNPVGLAAGFDKNGTLSPLMERLGFGFIEIGSITANPSTGNPEPRSFRLPEDQSLINRMGLNNDGAKTITRRLEKVSSWATAFRLSRASGCRDRVSSTRSWAAREPGQAVAAVSAIRVISIGARAAGARRT